MFYSFGPDSFSWNHCVSSIILGYVGGIFLWVQMGWWIQVLTVAAAHIRLGFFASATLEPPKNLKHYEDDGFIR